MMVDTAKPEDPQKRIFQFAYIRSFACMAIVLLHTVNSARVYHAGTISASQQAGAFAACSALMWAVPCFLMVTGALLLDRQKKVTRQKLFKYIKRVVIALVIFTAVFTVIRHDPASETGIVREFFDGLLRNHCMAYLWYLYLMIALYLLMPLFKAMTDRLSDRQLTVLLCAVLTVCSVLPLASYLGIEAALYIPTWTVYGAYLFMGHLLYRHRMDARLAAVIFVVCTVLLPFLTMRAADAGLDPAGFTGYNSPLVVTQSAAVYSLMLGLSKKPGAFIENTDRCSFGIYLIHMIFIRLTMKEMGLDLFAYGPAAFAAASAVYFIAAFAVTYLLKKFRVFSFL